MRSWRFVSSVSPMRPRSRAGAPELERTRPLTTFALDVALYGAVALCATCAPSPLRGEGQGEGRERTSAARRPADGQNHVQVEGCAVPAGAEAADGHIARQLPMEGRQLVRLDGAARAGRASVAHHRASAGTAAIS